MNKFIKISSQCPNCQNRNLVFNDISNIVCKKCNSNFPIVAEKPILIQQGNEIFPLSSYLNLDFDSKPKGKSLLSKIIPSPSVNLSYLENIKLFAHSLKDFNPAYILIVGSGQQKDYLEKLMSEYSNIQLIYCDIDGNATVDLFCDAHNLPFVDQVFHGIITTAVLEHVLYPERVVSEMYRVLVDGGVIYSEIPFMQQVHEGAYDFTRYTLSGHRRLLNHFSELSSGQVASAGTALVWSIQNFALCFAWNPLSRLMIKSAVRLLFFWLKYFDYLFINNPQAIDGASCTYFLGKKELNFKTSDQVIIERYSGANNLRHI